MMEQLAKIARALEVQQARLHRLSDRTPDEHWSARRDPSRWSVAECVAHLNLTSEVYLPLIQSKLDEARRMGVPPTDRYHMDFTGRMIAFFAGPLPRIGSFRFGRAKTPPAFVPQGDLPRSVLVSEFDRLQGAVTDFVHESDGLPIDRVRLRSPFAGQIQYSVYATFVIIPRHQERHLWQAEQVWA